MPLMRSVTDHFCYRCKVAQPYSSRRVNVRLIHWGNELRNKKTFFNKILQNFKLGVKLIKTFQRNLCFVCLKQSDGFSIFEPTRMVKTSVTRWLDQLLNALLIRYNNAQQKRFMTQSSIVYYEGAMVVVQWSSCSPSSLAI